MLKPLDSLLTPLSFLCLATIPLHELHGLPFLVHPGLVAYSRAFMADTPNPPLAGALLGYRPPTPVLGFSKSVVCILCLNVFHLSLIGVNTSSN